MTKKLDWQKQNQELDEIVDKLNNPSTNVEQATLLYKQAVKIIEQLEQYINQAKNEIEQVSTTHKK